MGVNGIGPILTWIILITRSVESWAGWWRPPSRLEFARSPAPTVPAPSIPTMQAIFYGYLTVIVAGIVFFSIVGLTHH
jgi:hypothetical protein